VGVTALGGLRSGEVVVSDPTGVGATVQQQLGGLALAAVRGAPQRVVEVLSCRLRRSCEPALHPVDEAERRGLPEARAGAAFQ
jgi:hypothetical protein